MLQSISTQCYNPAMATSVRSIRLRDEVWVKLGLMAEERKTTVNALLVRAAEEVTGQQRATVQVALPPSHAMSKAAIATVPLAGTFERKPYQKGGKR